MSDQPQIPRAADIDRNEPEAVRSMAKVDAVLALRLFNETLHRNAVTSDSAESADWSRDFAAGFFNLFIGDERVTPGMYALRTFYRGLLLSGAENWPAVRFRSIVPALDPWDNLLLHIRARVDERDAKLYEYTFWTLLGAYRWNPWNPQPACIIAGTTNVETRHTLLKTLVDMFVSCTIEHLPHFESVLEDHNDRIRIGDSEWLLPTSGRGVPLEQARLSSGVLCHLSLVETGDGERVTEMRTVPSMGATLVIPSQPLTLSSARRERYALLQAPVGRAAIPIGTAGFSDRRTHVLQLLVFLVENLIKVHALPDVATYNCVTASRRRISFMVSARQAGRFFDICRTVTIAEAVTARFLANTGNDEPWNLMNLLQVQPDLVVSNATCEYVAKLFDDVVII
jgi:hypothetical protein